MGSLLSLPVIGQEDPSRDLASLVVRRVGSLVETGDPWDPYRLVDPDGGVVGPVVVYLRELQAAGRPATTQRSYGLALLRWFRFLWTVEVAWNEATRVEARDFSRWIQIAGKPAQPHWRSPDAEPTVSVRAGSPNPVTGKQSPGREYAPATVAHCESVLRHFYALHLEARTGPLVNPFPLARTGRAHAHHNPMEPLRGERAGLFRPRLVTRIPRQIPDEMFNEVFARLSSHRDRALVAFWISTGARASELLGVLCSGADPGQQLITVVRKGSRALQPLPASPDAFVWLRLYQQQMHGLVPAGGDDPLWWTLRRPFRPLTYHAARAMFVRANQALGANWPLHDLRHSAAYRLARDPQMPITDRRAVGPRTRSFIDHTKVCHPDRRGRHRRRAGPPPAPGHAEGGTAAGAGCAALSAGVAGRSVRSGAAVTTTNAPAPAAGQPVRQLNAQVSALWAKFPPRPVPDAWEARRQDRGTVVRRLLAPPFAADTANKRYYRKVALLKVLDWLERYPGRTWQERWNATGASIDGRVDWRATVLRTARRRTARAAGGEDQLVPRHGRDPTGLR
ncbi:tyrosine-type recombinase/integrase [Saccharopolyspora hattusasensis]|uniref:tyrosine-type recombinase/integrase n=1 Tax=Saccharopolyspora hattusasensis TaxID=1128679 RepID=UPI003D99CECA